MKTTITNYFWLLNPNSRYISSAAVSGNDVYFAGYEVKGTHKVAVYWKNGQSFKLTSGTTDALLNSIAVSGNTVYAAGWESNGTSEVAKYWKNGIGTNPSDGTKNAEAVSISVWGNDILVVGNEYTPSNGCPECDIANSGVSKLWKNGALLTTGSSMQNFTAVATSNSGIYVAGNDGSYASYFKNGSAVHLTDGTSEASASAIAVWGNDIYVAGYENIGGHNVPTYWKNQTAVNLTNGINNAYLPAIFLQKQ